MHPIKISLAKKRIQWSRSNALARVCSSTDFGAVSRVGRSDSEHKRWATGKDESCWEPWHLGTRNPPSYWSTVHWHMHLRQCPLCDTTKSYVSFVGLCCVKQGSDWVELIYQNKALQTYKPRWEKQTRYDMFKLWQFRLWWQKDEYMAVFIKRG